MSKQLLEEIEEEIRIFFENYKKEHAGKELTPHEIAYDEKLRYYRDLKNAIETAKQDGYQKGLLEAKSEKIMKNS